MIFFGAFLLILLNTAYTPVVFAKATTPFGTVKTNGRSPLIASLWWNLRGGSSSMPSDINQMQRISPNQQAGSYPPSNPYPDSTEYPAHDATYAPQQYPPLDTPNTAFGEESIVDPIQETVQDRLDAWKEQQLQNMERYQRVPVDDKGRAKLLLSIGKSSRVMVFFVFTWRTLHLYEQVVGTSGTSGTTSSSVLFSNPLGSKAVFALPIFLLFLADILGTILSLTSISSITKKRLKAILNLNKFTEILVLFYSMVRLTIWPSQYITKEIYVGRVIHSLLLLVQVQAFTRLSWDETAAPSVSAYRDMHTADSSTPPQTASSPNPYGARGYSGSS